MDAAALSAAIGNLLHGGKWLQVAEGGVIALYRHHDLADEPGLPTPRRPSSPCFFVRHAPFVQVKDRLNAALPPIPPLPPPSDAESTSQGYHTASLRIKTESIAPPQIATEDRSLGSDHPQVSLDRDSKIGQQDLAGFFVHCTSGSALHLPRTTGSDACALPQ